MVSQGVLGTHLVPNDSNAKSGEHMEGCVAWEEHRALVVNLPVLVFIGKCQASCRVLGYEHNPICGHRSHRTILTELVLGIFADTCTFATCKR